MSADTEVKKNKCISINSVLLESGQEIANKKRIPLNILISNYLLSIKDETRSAPAPAGSTITHTLYIDDDLIAIGELKAKQLNTSFSQLISNFIISLEKKEVRDEQEDV